MFVKEVQAAVLDGRADLAVHSAKDLPSSPDLQPDGLVIGAVPERGDPRDAIVGGRLDDLPTGAMVATGSVRRRVQLASQRPDLAFTGLRGNIETRLAKIGGDVHAIVVAAAALQRLGRPEAATADYLAVSSFVPQVAQGALAIECRSDDGGVRSALAAIEHAPSRRAVDAERAFLAELGGGCDLPVGAHARNVGAIGGVDLGGELVVEGLIASADGRRVVRRTVTGDDPGPLGRALAAELLDDAGGRSLLA